MYLLEKLTGLLPATARPYAKALYPAAGTAAAVAVTWASTGVFDAAELRTALVGGFAALLTFAVPNGKAA